MRKLSVLIAVIFALSTVFSARVLAAADEGETMAMHNFYKASELLGKQVKGQEEKDLGRIENIIIGEDGKVEFAILSYGGLLGIGEKLVAIPWSALQVRPEAEYFTASLTREKVENAPVIQEGETFGPEWENRVNAYYGTGQESMEMEPRERGEMGAMTEGRRFETKGLSSGFAASDLMKKTVMSKQGEELGEVENVVISKEGKVKYLIVSRGGVLGVGEEYVAVPWSAMHISPEQEAFTLDITKEKFENAPTFEKSDWQKIDDLEWNKKVHSYFGLEEQHKGMKPEHEGEYQGSEMEKGY